MTIDFFLSDYSDFKTFVIWCMTYNPKILESFNDPFISFDEWEKKKEKEYEKTLKELEDVHPYSSTTQMYINHAIKTKNTYNKSDVQNIVNKHNKEYHSIQNKNEWISNANIHIATFDAKAIDYLNKYCQISFVRNILGLKTKWYNFLFFKK